MNNFLYLLIGLGAVYLLFYLEKLEKFDKIKFDIVNKYISYAFLGLLMILVVQSILPQIVPELAKTPLMVAVVAMGAVTFYLGRDKLEAIEKEAQQEKNDEKKREMEFREVYSGVNRIWGVRYVAKKIYIEGFYFWGLISIFILLVILYFLNLSTIKYINTDEARLFYDAKLIIEGSIPFKDFDARSPLIIYFLSIFIKIFGESLERIYIISICLVILTTFLLYILVKRLTNKQIALITIFIFGIAPINIMMLYVKTQTFQIPLILYSILSYDNYLIKKNNKYLILSGLFMLFALVCRESSLFFLSAFMVLIFIREKEQRISKLKVLIIFSAIITVIFFVIFSLFFTNKDVQMTSYLAKISLNIDMENNARILNVPFYFSYGYLLLFFISFINLPLILPYRNKLKDKIYPILLPYIVIFCLIPFYIYLLLYNGFWEQYLMEFAPFYSMIIGITIYILIRSMNTKILRILCFILIFALIIPYNLDSYIFIKGDTGAYNLEGVKAVSAYIHETTLEGEYIFGGNPIYSFLADRPHFMKLSAMYYEPEDVIRVFQNMEITPPVIIIEDSYIRRYYLINDEFKKFLESKYSIDKEFSYEAYGRKWSAKVYRFIE
ncbi:MAG: glycosyltransferase family 39 protein [Candidatus Methanoperedens sp.]|nr:MAG: glycosyltransferase family 39 protein [Candidatus Methanoperedens sp.]MBZ0176565.1 glycosyltransferase family 39 protein [Candidatus Methanoperedens nitroreducens]